MNRLLLCGLVLALAAPGLRAAPLERDLGRGLEYFRVHRLPGDLPADAAVGDHPVVLDIRYVPGDARDGRDLLAWLRRHAAIRHPVFLLANPETGPSLLAPLDSPDAVIGLIILGPAAPDFSPDIALHVSPAVERRAYEALEHGASVRSLTVDIPVKSRQDEAMLDREHLPDSALPDLEDEADQAGPAPSGPPPLIDAVLQRAIQLDRGLIALRRIPGPAGG